MQNTPAPNASDVLVVGGGLIGLSCALAAAQTGARVRVITDARPGEASRAAAGLLAPSIDRTGGPAHDFAVAARDRYPSYLEWLRDRCGIDVPLDRDGIVQVALNEAAIRGLLRAMPDGAIWLDRRELADAEPALAHGLGGVLHPLDGAVDNVRLHDALLAAVGSDPRIAVSREGVARVSFGNAATAAARNGEVYVGQYLVLCAGAWSVTIAGVPRALPVEPVRGQMISYDVARLRRPVYGPTGYAVPRRDGRTLIGATMERTGYDSVTTDAGIARLERSAAEIHPDMGRLRPSDAWAGLRPMSADLQPIIGRDPEEPRLLYATGHSRNGVLMTPITGDCIAALLADEPVPHDLSAFAADRFVATDDPATADNELGS